MFPFLSVDNRFHPSFKSPYVFADCPSNLITGRFSQPVAERHDAGLERFKHFMRRPIDSLNLQAASPFICSINTGLFSSIKGSTI